MIISTMLLLLRVVIFVKERAYYLLVRENTNVLLLDWGEPCRHKYLWMQSGGWTMWVVGKACTELPATILGYVAKSKDNFTLMTSWSKSHTQIELVCLFDSSTSCAAWRGSTRVVFEFWLNPMPARRNALSHLKQTHKHQQQLNHSQWPFVVAIVYTWINIGDLGCKIIGDWMFREISVQGSRSRYEFACPEIEKLNLRRNGLHSEHHGYPTCETWGKISRVYFLDQLFCCGLPSSLL